MKKDKYEPTANSKAKPVIIPIIITAAIAFSIGCISTNAIAGGTLQSKGKLVYTNPSTGKEEIVIDTADHEVLQDNIEANTNSINSIQSDLNSIDSDINKIKTYVGSDGKLHFINASGADTVLNFKNNGGEPTALITQYYIGTYTFTSNYDRVYCITFQGSAANPIYTGKGTFTVIDTNAYQHQTGLYKIENVKAGDTLYAYGYAMIFK